MEMVLKEIERALDGGFYYLAIASTLTLPEICAALESPTGSTKHASNKSYKDWYNKHLAAKYPRITDDDCYSLRCGVLHEGKFGRAGEMQYSRVLFTLPDGRGNVAHNNVLNDALNLDAVTFCRDFIAAVRKWYASAHHTKNVRTNLPRLVQYHPNGLAPYILGLPIIS